MKKILIVTYYFPPCNSVASHRPKSFAKHFQRHGLYPVVVTRHWRGDEKVWTDYHRAHAGPPQETEADGYRLVRLPYHARVYGRCVAAGRVPFAAKVLYPSLSALGRFAPEVNAFEMAYDYARRFLRENRVDYILVTSPPLNLIRLGYLLKKEFGVPLVCDFRDLWDNGILNRDAAPASPAAAVLDRLYRFHLARWLRHADLITSVSRPLLDELSRLNPRARAEVIMNGYEADLFDEFAALRGAATPKFTFSTVGTLYPEQDLSVMLDGLKIFLGRNGTDRVRLNFVGTASIEEVERLLRESLPPECTFISHRVPRAEAVSTVLGSDVLFHAGWRGYRGMVSTKIFEYLISGRNILIAPNDHDVMEEILTKTRAGRTAETAEEFAEILGGWFDEWKRDGRLSYHGREEEIGFYSREHQADLLAREILSL